MTDSTMSNPPPAREGGPRFRNYLDELNIDKNNQAPFQPLQQIDCYLMRHAESKYNEVMHSSKYQHSSQQAKHAYQMDASLIDCEITQKGATEIKNMCFPSSLKAQNAIELDIIFVSPLKRSLQTAKEVIECHGIKYKKAIVVKQLTEVVSKVCDFGDDLETKIKNYGQLFEFNFTDTIYSAELGNQKYSGDGSIAEKRQEKSNAKEGERDNLCSYFWQDELVDQSLKSQITRTKRGGQRYLQILDKVFPNPLQSAQNCLRRSLYALEKIRQIARANKARRIMVVSHNRILKNLLTKGEKDKLDTFQVMRNCEIRCIKL